MELADILSISQRIASAKSETVLPSYSPIALSPLRGRIALVHEFHRRQHDASDALGRQHDPARTLRDIPPLLIGRFSANTDPALVRQLEAAIRALGLEPASVIPASMTVDWCP
jgi:hypothetical protein